MKYEPEVECDEWIGKIIEIKIKVTSIYYTLFKTSNFINQFYQ